MQAAAPAALHVELGQHSCPFRPWRAEDGRALGLFAFDAETTEIDDDRPHLVPAYVVGAACDGRRGFFVTRDRLAAFFQAHRGVPFACHNAPFDLAVCAKVLGDTIDVYGAVDRHQVWDTMLLHRLLTLATEGRAELREAGLDDCARAHLGLALPKGETDAAGNTVRTSFGRFLSRPPAEIDRPYLAYLARDALATLLLFKKLTGLIEQRLAASPSAWGFVSQEWLGDAQARFGPLTHHVQLKASVLMSALGRNGVALDHARAADRRESLEARSAGLKVRLRREGYLPGERGCDKALQSIIARAVRHSNAHDYPRTPTGKYSSAEENLELLAGVEPFFADLAAFRQAENLISYLGKMSRPRLHAKFGCLLRTGRTSCGGGLNLQNLPRESGGAGLGGTIRGAFVPDEGEVFIDADYSQVELVVLAHAWRSQFGLGDSLARLINGGQDVHRLIAAAVLNKPASAVTKGERNSAKPVSFGRPGGMGAARLQRVARASYGCELALPQVEQRIRAYHELCPELDRFLEDEVNPGDVVARAGGMTPAGREQGSGLWCDPRDPASHRPAGWLGGMLLKALRDTEPRTKQGRTYGDEELDYLWAEAEKLPVDLPNKLRGDLAGRRPSLALQGAFLAWAGRRPVFTLTGRLRADATFCSARNTAFQGPAADGAILGLWRVWRAGYKLANFVHDQVVVASPDDGQVRQRVEEVEQLMREGMLEVVPGMAVRVESVVTRSFDKSDLAPHHNP